MQETRDTQVRSLGDKVPWSKDHRNPFQYSCLENPIDRGAWRATVHRVAKSQTWLKQQSQMKRLSTHTSHFIIHSSTDGTFDCFHHNRATNISIHVYLFKSLPIILSNIYSPRTGTAGSYDGNSLTFWETAKPLSTVPTPSSFSNAQGSNISTPPPNL